MSWLKAINPGAPINGEAEAKKAARASAVSIFIGVIVGIVGAAYTWMNMDALTATATATAGGDAATAAAAEMGVQMGLYLGAALVVIQLVFALVQWRDPKKFIATLFIVLIVLGLLMTLLTPMMADMVPNAPVTPMWQIALSAGIMVIQLVMHIAGLRGIKALDEIQMADAR